MSDELKSGCDAVLAKAIDDGVPGVVAMATDADGTTYEGVAGKRALGGDQDMTADTVFAIFSTTKAVAGTAALQLVESGDLDLDAPAKEYAPPLGDVQVLDGFDDDGQPAPATAGQRTSPRGSCSRTPRASATTSSTRTTRGWPTSTASPA